MSNKGTPSKKSTLKAGSAESGSKAKASKASDASKPNGKTDGVKAVQVNSPQTKAPTAADRAPSETKGAPRQSKVAMLVDALSAPEGATIEKLRGVTSWQSHSVRAALTGLKKKGYEFSRTRVEGVSVYSIVRTPEAVK